MLNIFYCHGFASSFDPGNSKVQTLARLGSVSGCNIDYTRRADEVISHVIERGNFANVDVIVGTSMGGWLATELGSSLGIPFVAINPAADPSQTLRNYIGAGEDYQGKPYTLSESTVASYYPIAKNGCGLILLDEADEVIEARHTQQMLSEYYQVEVFEGGNHRFAHMEEALPLIESFQSDAEVVYGLGET
ncbi:YqiA/YcfP family alpha/beta fold hydrolase [Marinobacter persicus]|uniref:Esterase n=1 Tax=Marinobacter persicus TaxID=930118 RepID=A0A2S6G2P7_9GAMM|nr:YqiA/YcfP family alpha/beta fold hydrolase [Marinobacter persicus]PPK50050.1 hypothetical protein BY455_13620 [Marinobacter persicus]PPK52236.1 hypothetical protein B0H24_103620 [Marinobacter persicus]PPK56627.1 hypothetical protein BY454_13620 [Marinobacter persicus]